MAFVGIVLLMLWGAPAAAATFTVSKTGDSFDGVCDADCSLREAVHAANQAPGADVIRLTHAYYRLTRAGADDVAAAGDLDVTDAVTIRGLPDRSTVDADFIDRILHVRPGARAELVDITLKEGEAAARGGGALNEGELILRRSWVTASRVRAENGVLEGGGIHNAGTLRLIFAKIYRNRALDALTPLGGRGGGIYSARGATLSMYDSDVRENVTGLDDAYGFGAGLYSAGRAHVERSFFFRNDPGDGEGAAIAVRDGGALTLRDSTLSGNGHDGATGALTVNTQLESNAEAPARATLYNVTIANNNGGGLYNNARVNLYNTLIAGNYTQDGNDRYYDSGLNCFTRLGGETRQHFSLIGADGNCPAHIAVDNATVFTRVLEHLAYLGGPTPVHPLRPGPYAIDTGDNATCTAFDQRGGRRPADGDSNGTEICDIGAMEVNADE